MKVIADVTRPHRIKIMASLNPIMLDATGCAACSGSLWGKIKFACVDGPEFDAHLVDFDELMMRQRIYLDEKALHKCRLDQSLESRAEKK